MNDRWPSDERRMVQAIGRRRFLIGAAAAAAAATAVAAGCSSDGSSDGGGDGDAPSPTTATTAPNPKLSGSPFTLGVASGDPTKAAVVLWTRLAIDPVDDAGTGAMPDEPVSVVWEIATDADLTTVVDRGVAIARPEHAHSVHVDVTGLDPATTYWYRFQVDDELSPIGQTQTLAEGATASFGLAIVNCQMYENGAYAAYRHLLDEDVDLVAHLGDYIYEYPGGEGEGRHSAPNRLLITLADYRIRYGSYKVDPDLAAAHARFAFVCTWDDHEVANNYMGDTAPGDISEADVRDRKAAAYQAWWEHMPVRMDPPDGSDLAVYRDFQIGDLATFYLLDERQDGDVPPCRDTAGGATDYGDCAEVADDRTRLGEAQEAWLGDALATSTTTWNLLGNPVVLAGVDAGTDEDAYYLDTWDGYPQARTRLIEQLAGVDNPVVLTGDYHAGMVLDVRETPFDQSSPLVAAEFMAPPISSGLFAADVSARTPQLLQQINAHGYLTVDVTPEQLTATFRTLADVTDPDSTISTEAVWVVEAGDPEPRQVS